MDFYTSHEALILGYEEALTRKDSLTGGWYDTSAHLVWCGERTRQLDGAHLHFLSGINNPVAAKVGPGPRPRTSWPSATSSTRPRAPGRLTLISRMGWRRPSNSSRPPEGRPRSGHPVVWACDPMHGNTFVSEGGRKTRHFDDVLSEIRRSSPRAGRQGPGRVASTSSSPVTA